MRPLIMMVVLAAAGLKAGSCDPAHFRHALGDPAQSKPDPRLSGVWAGRVGDSASTLHFVARSEGPLDVVLVAESEKDGAGLLAYQGFATSVGGQTYLSLREKQYSSLFLDKFTLAPTYQLVRLDFEASGAMTPCYLPEDALDEALASKALHREGKGKALVIGDDAKALAIWVAKPTSAAAFKPLGRFQKVSLDYGPIPDAGP